MTTNDSKYKKKILSKFNLLDKEIDYFGYTLHKSDTIAIVSYFDLFDEQGITLFLNNEIKTDSMKGFGTVRKVIPIPSKKLNEPNYIMKLKTFSAEKHFYTKIVGFNFIEKRVILHKSNTLQ